MLRGCIRVAAMMLAGQETPDPKPTPCNLSPDPERYAPQRALGGSGHIVPLRPLLHRMLRSVQPRRCWGSILVTPLCVQDRVAWGLQPSLPGLYHLR